MNQRTQPDEPLIEAFDFGTLGRCRRLRAPAGELFFVQPQIVLLLGGDPDKTINGGVIKDMWPCLGLLEIGQLLFRTVGHAIDRVGDQGHL